MSSTYDSSDLLANAIGVGLALSLDAILSKNRSRNPETKADHQHHRAPLPNIAFKLAAALTG